MTSVRSPKASADRNRLESKANLCLPNRHIRVECDHDIIRGHLRVSRCNLSCLIPYLTRCIAHRCGPLYSCNQLCTSLLFIYRSSYLAYRVIPFKSHLSCFPDALNHEILDPNFVLRRAPSSLASSASSSPSSSDMLSSWSSTSPRSWAPPCAARNALSSHALGFAHLKMLQPMSHI